MSTGAQRLSFEPELRIDLTRRLERFERRPLSAEGQRRSAVALVVVDDGAGQASVLLTRRASTLRRHSGQFALPGGRMDPGETPEDAALRELEEEVGLALGPEAILGRLDDFVTRSGYHIAPIVAWGGAPGPLRPEPEEVAAIYRVPLGTIADPETLQVEELGTTGDSPVMALAIVDTWVFAPTAAILLQLADLAVWGRSTRVAHYEQPRFAWT
ncbi:MAG: CoA pyrophosphatase [Acidobacteriota bacterium]